MATGGLDAIVEEFVVECDELIDRLNADLLCLETNPDQPIVLQRLFRYFHTLKGGAAFLAFDPIVTICHEAEGLVENAQYAESALPAASIEACLLAVDQVQRLLQIIRQGQPLNDESDADEKGNQSAGPDSADSQASGGERGDHSNHYPDDDELMGDDDFEALLDQLHGEQVPGAGKLSPPLTPDESKRQPEPELEPSSLEASLPSTNVPPSIRIATSSIDHAMHLVSELVLIRNRLEHTHWATATVSHRDDLLHRLSRVTTELQHTVSRVRMQPIGALFGRYPRMVRDLAVGLNKDVVLISDGEATELDRELVEALSEPMVHLLRNAIDHGIEAPDIRIAQGKSATGTITLSAAQVGDSIRIVVRDDGAGIDTDAILQKAISMGRLPETQSRTDAQLLEMVFEPGFSTAQGLSEMSGRGVGMDVVKSSIERIGGAIQISSEVGKGTEIRIDAPLTLTIASGLLVEVAGRMLAIPMSSISEVRRLGENLRDDEEEVDLIDLADLFAPQRSERSGRLMLVAQIGLNRMGFLVDKLLSQEEMVIKPLGDFLEDVVGFGGATVTSEGVFALIADLPGLARAAA